jgi:dTDP-4-amino-4,6-dideoxygalactose transaminase
VTDWGGPRGSYEAHRDTIDSGIRRVLDSGWYVLGDEVELFENASTSFTGVNHAVACGSGTDALVLALRALGIRPGDMVATVSQTAVATVAAIEMCGAIPALVDIQDESMTMCPDSLQALLREHGERIRAIVPVHLYGHPADLAAISGLAATHGASLLEDCAQAHGARRDGRLVGSWGEAAAYSFYPTKNLGALGDGGMLATGNAGVADRARQLRQYGWRERYISEIPGLNSRLDPIQAAVLGAKLPHLASENARRRGIAALYTEAIDGIVRCPSVAPGAEHVFHQYVVRTAHRTELRDRLAGHGVPVAVLYPAAVHQQPAYTGRVPVAPGGLPVTERVVSELLCLPVHPQMDDEAVGVVIDLIRAWGGRA